MLRSTRPLSTLKLLRTEYSSISRLTSSISTFGLDSTSSSKSSTSSAKRAGRVGSSSLVCCELLKNEDIRYMNYYIPCQEINASSLNYTTGSASKVIRYFDPRTKYPLIACSKTFHCDNHHNSTSVGSLTPSFPVDASKHMILTSWRIFSALALLMLSVYRS